MAINNTLNRILGYPICSDSYISLEIASGAEVLNVEFGYVDFPASASTVLSLSALQLATSIL